MIKSQNEQHRHCPGEEQFEFLCLEDGMAADEMRRIQLHLQQCDSCRVRMDKMDQYYSILSHEIGEPVSNQVLDFAKSLASKEVKYGLIACEPLLDKPNGKGQGYRAELLFCANGDGGRKKMADFDLVNVDKYNLIVRFMTDTTCHSTMIYLWSPEYFDFRDWILHLPGHSDQVRFTKAGAAEAPVLNFEKLHKKILYFERDLEEHFEGTRLEKINGEIFLHN